jgi:hypothetical protein
MGYAEIVFVVAVADVYRLPALLCGATSDGRYWKDQPSQAG